MHIGIIMIRWSIQGAWTPTCRRSSMACRAATRRFHKIKETIVNCGKLGIPVIEYNFYNHRASDGYAHVQARGGATSNEFKYERMKDLPPMPGEGPIPMKTPGTIWRISSRRWCRWPRRTMWRCRCIPTIRRRR